MVSAAPPADRDAPGVRRERVRQRVVSAGFVRVDELARLLDVSVMTVHRDLDVLEADGWLTKIRGGATANPSALLEAGIPERTAALRAEKEAIAAVAARLLSRGQTVFLDDSTTSLGLVPHLLEHAPITVATNFLPVVAAVGRATAVELQVLGGEYHARQDACFGVQTSEAIGRLQADLVFMSTTALNHGRCLFRAEASVAVRRAFLAAATRRVLLVDHAKIGRPSPHVLCGVEEFDLVITDDGIDPEDLAELRARTARVEVAVVRR